MDRKRGRPLQQLCIDSPIDSPSDYEIDTSWNQLAQFTCPVHQHSGASAAVLLLVAASCHVHRPLGTHALEWVSNGAIPNMVSR